MGYTTDFEGHFALNRKLTPKLQDYLVRFSETRRMSRKLPEKYGVEGEFYVDGGGEYGQDREPDIIDYNTPPSTQPGLWCQWRPTEDGMGIEWDGGEKFYHYAEWLTYIINNFLAPKGYVLNGQVSWQGEDSGDIGVLEVKDNKVIEHAGVYELTENSELEEMASNILEILSVSKVSSTKKTKLIDYLNKVVNG